MTEESKENQDLKGIEVQLVREGNKVKQGHVVLQLEFQDVEDLKEFVENAASVVFKANKVSVVHKENEDLKD